MVHSLDNNEAICVSVKCVHFKTTHFVLFAILCTTIATHVTCADRHVHRTKLYPRHWRQHRLVCPDLDRQWRAKFLITCSKILDYLQFGWSEELVPKDDSVGSLLPHLQHCACLLSGFPWGFCRKACLTQKISRSRRLPRSVCYGCHCFQIPRTLTHLRTHWGVNSRWTRIMDLCPAHHSTLQCSLLWVVCCTDRRETYLKLSFGDHSRSGLKLCQWSRLLLGLRSKEEHCTVSCHFWLASVVLASTALYCFKNSSAFTETTFADHKLRQIYRGSP
jgi:hypothetical protein